MATRSSTLSMQEDRIVALESAIALMSESIRKLEVAVLGVDEVKSAVAAREVVNLAVEDRLSTLEKQVQELASGVEGVKIRFEDFDKEWPALGDENGEGFTVVEGRRSKRGRARGTPLSVAPAAPEPRLSMAHRLRESSGRVLIAGDSLARGVGHKLREQCGDMVEVRAFGGAKLGSVRDSVVGMRRDETRQLVVVAGANSIAEPAADLMSNFGEIIDAGKENSKELVMIGLIKRYDVGHVYESKRIVVNGKLRALCESKEVRFVEYEPERSRVHRDGLHLNFRGQNELGRKIFAATKPFLVHPSASLGVGAQS